MRFFPTGSRIGLVPPLAMALSRRFMGFEDAEHGAAILLSTLPGDAFKHLDKSMVPEALEKQGIESKREPFAAAGGNGFLLSGKQTTAQVIAITNGCWSRRRAASPRSSPCRFRSRTTTYSDKVVRDALSTLAVRASVPDAERLSLLPFTVGDLAGFHIDDVLPGRALMLVRRAGRRENNPTRRRTTQTTDAAGHSVDARFLIAALPGGPHRAEGRR